MSGDVGESCMEEDTKVNIEETTVNLDSVKEEPKEDALDVEGNSQLNQYRITLEYENTFGETGFKFEEDEDNLVGFMNNDVIMENEIVKLESIKKEDESLNNFNCAKCNGYYKGYCLKCSTLSYILNRNVSFPISNTELNNMPVDILEIRETLRGTGAFLLRSLPKNVIFGPFEGISGIESINGHSWKINDGKLLNVDNGNWMKHVCVTNASFKNLDIFQIDGSLYFQTNREITEGEELLVYYDDKETQKSDNSNIYYYTPQTREKLPTVFACMLCCLGFESDRCLMEHKRKCPHMEHTRSAKDFELVECHYCKMWLEKWEHQEYHVAYCLEKHHRVWCGYSETANRSETSVEEIEEQVNTNDYKTEYRVGCGQKDTIKEILCNFI